MVKCYNILMANFFTYPQLPLSITTTIDGDDIKKVNKKVLTDQKVNFLTLLFNKDAAKYIKEKQVYICTFEADKIFATANGNIVINGPYEELSDYSEDDRFIYLYCRTHDFICLERTVCPPDFIDYIRKLFTPTTVPEPTPESAN